MPGSVYRSRVTRERRHTPRLRLAVPVLIDGPGGIRRCLARDISPGGLFVEYSEALAPGTELRVIFTVPDGSTEMTCRCLVRHVHHVRSPGGTVRGLGLSFEGFEIDAGDLVTAARREHA